jgi:hypothetical protein
MPAVAVAFRPTVHYWRPGPHYQQMKQIRIFRRFNLLACSDRSIHFATEHRRSSHRDEGLPSFNTDASADRFAPPYLASASHLPRLCLACDLHP